MLSNRDKNKKLNRRDFFKKTAAFGLGVTVGGSSFWRPSQTSGPDNHSQGACAPQTLWPFGHNGLHSFTGGDVRHPEQSVGAGKGARLGDLLLGYSGGLWQGPQ